MLRLWAGYLFVRHAIKTHIVLPYFSAFEYHTTISVESYFRSRVKVAHSHSTGKEIPAFYWNFYVHRCLNMEDCKFSSIYIGPISYIVSNIIRITVTVGVYILQLDIPFTSFSNLLIRPTDVGVIKNLQFYVPVYYQYRTSIGPYFFEDVDGHAVSHICSLC